MTNQTLVHVSLVMDKGGHYAYLRTHSSSGNNAAGVDTTSTVGAGEMEDAKVGTSRTVTLGTLAAVDMGPVRTFRL